MWDESPRKHPVGSLITVKYQEPGRWLCQKSACRGSVKTGVLSPGPMSKAGCDNLYLQSQGREVKQGEFLRLFGHGRHQSQ